MSSHLFTSVHAFAVHPAESLTFDQVNGRLLTVHSGMQLVSSYSVSDDKLKGLQVKSGQNWLVSASCVAVHPDCLFVITNPCGRLLRADADGKVRDKFDIWHRYLTDLFVSGDWLLATDRRNDVVMQWDVKQPLTEASSQLIGRGSLHRPLAGRILLTYLLVVQKNGIVVVFDESTGFKLSKFGQPLPMAGEHCMEVDRGHLLVLLARETEKLVDVFCLADGRQPSKSPNFMLSARLEPLPFGPSAIAYDCELRLMMLLDKRRRERSRVHVYEFQADEFNYM